MSSDFFLEDADIWRAEAWGMIQKRQDLDFVIITKRIHRFEAELPKDWGDGYDHVTICCTCENQEQADRRLPIFLNLPIKHRMLIHEPMLEPIDIRRYLATGKISQVTCGGESGPEARICDYSWITGTMQQCRDYHVPFWFKQTGSRFQKDRKVYLIERKYQMNQARKAGINYLYEEF